MVKLVFYGSEKSDMTETELTCLCVSGDEIYIAMQDAELKNYIVLDKSTAIKFSKELRKQIALIEDEKGI
jgi:hypothetical protein